jgi:uncharacterized protein involved in exopolysaccharide biosynthesis
MNTNANNHPQSDDEDDGPSVSPVELAKFAWDAARRNRTLCVSAGLCALLIGFTALSVVPRRYESTSKVYVSSAGFITSQLTSGRRALGDEDGIKDLYEAVFNHSNLLALVREAQLVDNWPKTRNWFQRLVDRARASIAGPTSRPDMEEMLLPMLERMIEAKPEDNASIRFHVSWRDSATAQKLTQLVQRNYIASKEVDELAAITRATTVLEEELKRTDAELEPAVKDLQEQIVKLRDEAKSKLQQAPKVASAPATPSVTEAQSTRASATPLELTTKLNELRNEERAVLEPWQRRNAELKFQLADLLAVYGPAHPAVVQLETKLKAVSAEPLELIDLRQREAELKANIASLVVSGHIARGSVPAAFAAGKPMSDNDISMLTSNSDDPRLAPARVQLQAVLHKSQEMQGRLDSARMELAIAQVGFKYRYRESEPARLWPKPVSPKIPVLAAAIVGISLVIGLFSGAARELIGGRVMEAWQIKQLGVDVLAQLNVRAVQLPAEPRSSDSDSRRV